jgi:hypothetical protein
MYSHQYTFHLVPKNLYSYCFHLYQKDMPMSISVIKSSHIIGSTLHSYVLRVLFTYMLIHFEELFVRVCECTHYY